jgi:hypothetical protein
MTHEPQIKLLPEKHRKRLFGVLVLIFVITLPSMIFYTTGYRVSFDNEETTIVTTGGMYITTDNLEVDVYLDEEKVEKPRLFRAAYYIQDVEAGKHRVVVQRPDLQTWVKELNVDSRIVVEAVAFNMPTIPHLRPITKYVTEEDEPVYMGTSSISEFMAGATSTVSIFATSSSATSTYNLNTEFTFIESLFGSTSTSTLSVFERLMEGVERFKFATTSENILATTTEEKIIEKNNMRLVQSQGEIYAEWKGELEKIPYYFCIPNSSQGSTTERYGQHVTDAFLELEKSTTTNMMVDSDRVCRPEIKLNRIWQDVYFYDFMPNSSDLVLLKLDDGLYVTEIDDRAWQNTQLIYRGSNFKVLVENDVIYVLDGDRYFEVITEIELE